MISAETLAIIYGLSAAAVWGTGDFAGGLASRRTVVTRVVMFAHSIGFIFFVALALLFGEPFSPPRDLLFGALAGLSGMGGLLALYRGLAENEMGITAPLAAVVTAVIPILFGFATEGLPTTIQMLGFAIGLGAVWFLAGSSDGSGIRWGDLTLPVIAGLGFAMFLVFIDQVEEGAVFWPLAVSRTASVLFIIAAAGFGFLTISDSQEISSSQDKVEPNVWMLILLAGLFDAAGNAFTMLAAQTGRLDITSILSSMYPASTILLAWLILGERLSVPQRWGAVLALVAVVLIAI